MIAAKRNLELSDPARQDVYDILSYTLRIWGERHLARYKAKLDAAFKAIVQKPRAGKPRYGMLVHAVEKHLIYYRIREESIYIVRVLHERMDPQRHIT